MLESLFSPRERREHEIAIQAQQVALNLFPTGRVEPEVIAEKTGIEYCYDSFSDEVDGILLPADGRFFIVCNERRARRGSARSRFTFAHELGHYFIAEHREALVSGRMPAQFSLAEFVSNRPVEREADVFAANLLMPYVAFVDRLPGGKCGLAEVRSQAEYFGTSVTATAFRALDTDLLPAPAAVLRWDRTGRLLGRRVARTWSFRHGRILQLVASAPPGTVTAEVLGCLATGSRSGRSDCFTWFDGLLYADEPDNLPLCEEVMALGKFGLPHPDLSRGTDLTGLPRPR
ncbi:MAG: ImmA/IrrE family metallo-endopeptidase [Opitutaceae bacterium]|nr:ImmA/IrrE family metallo-endopeptidase [Opitutaceae bacterium]